MSKQKYAIERCPFRSEVIKLASGGASPKEIADNLNDWHFSREDGFDYTPGMVEKFLKDVTNGVGQEAIVALTRIKDRANLTSLAKEQLELFKRESTKAWQQDDMKKFNQTQDRLMQWFDRVGRIEDIFAAETQTNIQVNNFNVEYDAFKWAIKEVLRDYPDLWSAIKTKTNERIQTLEAETV